MPENRYGALNPQPLYNATGRINRGQSAGVPQFSAPAAGVSKDFGTSNMPNNAAGAQGGFGANLVQSMYYGGPGNPMNVWGNSRGRGGSSRRGQRGGGDGGGNIDNSITIGAFTGFGANSGMQANQQGLGGQNLNAYNPNNSSATAQAPQRKQMTPEQRARNNATAKARRGLQSSIAKEGTPEQQARVAKQGVAGGKARQPRAPKAQTAQPSVGGYSNNTSAPTIQANVTDARQASQTTSINSPHAPTGPGQPGAPAISFGSVTGASMGKPAKIGSSKVGKR